MHTFMTMSLGALIAAGLATADECIVSDDFNDWSGIWSLHASDPAAMQVVHQNNRLYKLPIWQLRSRDFYWRTTCVNSTDLNLLLAVWGTLSSTSRASISGTDNQYYPQQIDPISGKRKTLCTSGGTTPKSIYAHDTTDGTGVIGMVDLLTLLHNWGSCN